MFSPHQWEEHQANRERHKQLQQKQRITEYLKRSAWKTSITILTGLIVFQVSQCIMIYLSRQTYVDTR